MEICGWHECNKSSFYFRNLLSQLGRPVRPATAYLLYCGDRRKGLAGWQGKDLRVKIAAEWKEMSEAKREVSLNHYITWYRTRWR